MTIDAFAAEIARFLSTPDAEVLCITGKWGVGKTFAWNRYLQEAARQNSIALKKYAYVSLFGLSSLADVRQAVFENTVNVTHVSKSADIITLRESVENVVARWRKTSGLISATPKLSDYAQIINKVGFLSVRSQIICLDDLERSSSNASVRDILGLASSLKELKACKIVLLLNDERLEGDNFLEFRSQLEKVADTFLQFEPTASEASNIAVPPERVYHDRLVQCCIDLNIVNIRLINKLDRFCKRLAEELTIFDPRILQQAVHSVVLFGYAKFQPTEAPTLEFIKSHNTFEGILDKDEAVDPSVQKWRDLLRNYEYGSLDEFDLVILQGVKRGHFDWVALNKTAEDLQKQLVLSDQDASFSKAWDIYHNSFNDNADELIDAFDNAVRTGYNAISPGNFSSTVDVIRKLGRPELASALIEYYINARQEEANFWDLNDTTFGFRVTDPEVRQAFKKKYETFTEPRDLASVLIKIARSSGWSKDDLLFLADRSAREFYDVFKALSGPDFRSAIDGALTFRNIGNADSQMQKIAAAATEALRMVAEESPLNLRRVEQLAVALTEPKLDDDDA